MDLSIMSAEEIRKLRAEVEQELENRSIEKIPKKIEALTADYLSGGGDRETIIATVSQAPPVSVIEAPETIIDDNPEVIL